MGLRFTRGDPSGRLPVDPFYGPLEDRTLQNAYKNPVGPGGDRTTKTLSRLPQKGGGILVRNNTVRSERDP